MAHNPDLSLVEPAPSEETWTPQAEKLYDQGVISADGARQMSGLPVSEHASDESARPGVVESVGQTATGQSAGLELVTDDHKPQPGARREASLREPRAARTAKEKADRDKGEALKHKTPPEWTPYVAIVPGPSKPDKQQ